MAARGNSTCFGAYEDDFSVGCEHSEAAVSRAFEWFLKQFVDLAAAETRLELPEADVCSAAFGDDLQHADAVRDRLIEAACDVIAVPDLREADRALQRLSGLLITLFQAESTVTRQWLLTQAAKNRDVFDISGASAAARQARGMQTAFFQLLDAVAGMREFGGPGLRASAPAVELSAETPTLIPA